MSMTEYEKKSLAILERTGDALLAKGEIIADEARKQTQILNEIRFRIASYAPHFAASLASYQQGTVTREGIAEVAMEAFRSANQARSGMASIFAGSKGLDQPLPEDPQSWASELGMINLKGVAGPGSQAGSSGYSMGDWVRGARFVEARVNTRMAARVENAREGRDKAQAELAKRTQELDKATQGWAGTTIEREELKLKLSQATAELATARAANSGLMSQNKAISQKLCGRAKARKAK